MFQTKTVARIILFYGIVGCIGVLVAFHPTLLSSFAKIQADTGDTRFVHYVLEHSFQAIFNRDYEASLWSPRFFFPFENGLALSENLLGAAPIYWLARVFLPPELAYSLWTIACAVLCYACFAFFLRSLRVSHFLSAFGGFIFGFGLVRIGRLYHAQLLPQFFTPLALLFVWRFLRKPTLGDLRLALLFIFLQLTAGIYLGWFLVFGLLIFVPLFLRFEPGSFKSIMQFVKDNWKSTIATILVWLLALFGFLSPYFQILRSVKVRYFVEVETMLPRLSSWLHPPPHTIWYSTLAPLSNGVPAPHEHTIFIGFTVYALVGVALYVLLRQSWMLSDDRAALTKAALLTALIIMALSLYIAPNFTLWKAIYRVIPGATVIRAVGRIALIVEFFLLIAAVVGLDSWLKRSRLKPKAANAIALLVLLACIPENLIWNPPAFAKAPILRTQAEWRELMQQGCDIAYVNLTSGEYFYTQQILAMWAGLQTKVPVINGYSGSQPPDLPGSITENLPFSSIMEWLHTFKRPPTGRLCLIAPTNHPLTAARQVENGISVDSLGSKTQYFSRDRRYTAFVVSLPLAMPPQAYAQGIRVADQPKSLASDQTITLPVIVRNTSPMTWIQTKKQPIEFSYRWFSADGKADLGDGVRTHLPTIVPAGKAVALNAMIKAPTRPGQYTLRLSLVHENVSWFMDRGGKTLDLPMTIVPASEGLSYGKPKS